MALHIFWFWYYDRIAAYFHHYATYEIPYGLYIHINVHFPKHKHFICMAKFFIYNIFTIHKNDWPNSMMMNFCWWCCLCKKFNSVIFSCDFLIRPQPSTFLLVYYDIDAGNDSDNIIFLYINFVDDDFGAYDAKANIIHILEHISVCAYSTLFLSGTYSPGPSQTSVLHIE